MSNATGTKAEYRSKNFRVDDSAVTRAALVAINRIPAAAYSPATEPSLYPSTMTPDDDVTPVVVDDFGTDLDDIEPSDADLAAIETL